MRRVAFIFGLSGILLMSSCCNCEPWGKKAERAYKEVKTNYGKNFIGFDAIKMELDRTLETIDSSYQRSPYDTWNIDSLRQSPNAKDFGLLTFFQSCDIQSGNIFTNDWIFFYPRESATSISDCGDCPAFSYQIVYVKSNQFPETHGLNSRWFKIADYWYIRTIVASL